MTTIDKRRFWTTKRTYLFVSYLIALLLVASILIDKVDSVPKTFNRFFMATRVNAQFIDLMKEHPGTVMLGDSHSWTLGKTPAGANHAGTGIMVADVPGTMPANIGDASAILLMVGTHDIWRGKSVGLAQRLKSLAAALPKRVPLVWSGIPPGVDFQLDMNEIQAANAVIQSLCAARPNCVYVDTWKLLMDGKGEPNDDLFLADGVHLSADGYRRWLAALDTTLDGIEQ